LSGLSEAQWSTEWNVYESTSGAEVWTDGNGEVDEAGGGVEVDARGEVIAGLEVVGCC